MYVYTYNLPFEALSQLKESNLNPLGSFKDHHHHRPLIPLCGVRTTCFLLPFSSITRHLHCHSFYFHVIFHTIHPSFPRPTSTRVPIYIHSHHSCYYVTFLRITCSYQANLLLLIFSDTGATFKLPLIYLVWP
jgi:hypothetical protein